ncbi:MAG TPA: hypothetical protein VM100_07730, partial [Longimicrobiales bacterium]|nr:hypothetical protein [Longimicrobiales bacterium]
MAFFDEMKQRKVVQWALAYAAGAWATLQLLDILSSTYSLSPFVMRAAPIVLATGLLIVVVLAWYHGEKGMQRITATELTIVT